MTAGVRGASVESGVAHRLVRARAALEASGAGALLVGVGADLQYLTGYAAHLLERLTMLVLPVDGRPRLVAPRLEIPAAEAAPAMLASAVEIVAWDETDDPYAAVASVLMEAQVDPASRLLVDPGLWAMHLLGLQRALPGRGFGLATEVTRELRMVKSADEVERLRAAARAADRVVLRMAAGRLVGRTEADVAREVRERLIDEGHEKASFAIVASGPNAASPHHEPGDRVIEAGDPIVLDIGGVRDGYCSDTTRTMWVTGGDPRRAPVEEFETIYRLVEEAQRAATEAVRPGIACADVDAVARRIIADGGYGDAFLHRLGHGIGLEAHEEPYLVAGNREPLREGAAFSIEPGIYLAGRYGVRIEDIVVCGEGGPEVLNETSRELMVVAG